MKSFRTDGLCLGFLVAGLLFSSAALGADVPISEKARAHFNAGVSLLQDPDGARYEEAYREFRAAYADSPSWKVLGNLGISAMKLERDGEAIEAFQKYLAQGGAAIDRDEKAQMARDLATLTAGVVQVELSSVPAGASIVDERVPLQGATVKNTYGPVADKLVVGVRPGQHRFTAHLDGHEDEVWTADAQPGSALQHQFTLKEAPVVVPVAPPPLAGSPVTSAVPPAQAQRPVPTGVYIGLVATGALAIGTGVVGGLSLAKHADFQSKNDGSDPGGAQTLRDSGKTLNLVTDVLLGSAVVAGGITAVLYFSRPTLTADHATLRLTPFAAPQVGGLSLAGSF